MRGIKLRNMFNSHDIPLSIELAMDVLRKIDQDFIRCKEVLFLSLGWALALQVK